MVGLETMTATLLVPPGNTGLACSLVADYCGDDVEVADSQGDKVVLTTTGGDTLTGLAPVCFYLASTSSKREELLGDTAAHTAEVSQWLTWCSTHLKHLMDDKLQEVNSWLLSRTYITGNRFSLADIVLLGVLHPAVISFPAAQTKHFCNLLRWYDFVQHKVSSSRISSPLQLAKPKFAPPVTTTTGKDAASTANGSSRSHKTAAAAPPPSASSSQPKHPAGAAGPQASTVASDKPAGAPPSDSPSAAPSAQPATDGAAAVKGKQGKAQEPKAKAAKGAAGSGDASAKAAPAAAADGGGGSDVHIGALDLRVGHIVKVQKHPNADALYLEEIDLGEGKPRQVISGLVKFVPIEAMHDRAVVVVANLKAAKMREVMSYGMVLCASSDAHDQCEPVVPPSGAVPGDRVTVPGFESEPMPEINNTKKKILEKLFPDMRTDASGTPTYKGQPMVTASGPLTSTIPNAWVK